MCVDQAGVEPAAFSLQGSCASSCATGPWSRERESNPPCKAYETSLIPDLPQCDGVTGRTRTGFLRGHIPACRPLQPRPQSTREESNLRHPLCERGGLPLTYSSFVGRASWSRTTSSRVISAVPSPSGSRPCVDAEESNLQPPACRAGALPLAPRVGGGPRSARISSCRVSTGRSTVRASGPWACSRTERSKVHALAGIHVTGEGTLVLRIEQTEPAAGIEPAASRVRAERPAVRTSPAGSGRRESNPRLRCGAPTCCPLTPRPRVAMAAVRQSRAADPRRPSRSLRCPCS